jgi:serine/threonine protein phosphatase PrpC
MHVTVRSDQGPRETQQDAFAWEQVGRPEGEVRLCCVLCDGMGGTTGGGVASRLAAVTVLETLHRPLLTATDDQWRDGRFCRAILRSAMDSASAILGQVSRGDPGLAELATTIALTIHLSSAVLVCHSGDTRVYAYGNRLRLLTRDHSAAWPLVDSKVLSVSDVRHMGTRSTLTKFLDSQSAEFDASLCKGGEGASYLLATDGFWELFDAAELEALLAPCGEQGNPWSGVSAEEIANRLQEEARQRPLADNASFILVTPEQASGERTGPYPRPGAPATFVRVEGEEENHDGECL